MTKLIDMCKVQKHKNSKSCWIVIHDDVYDVTEFLCQHPGGADSLLEVAGKDGTREFEDVGHSDDAKTLMKKYKIGTLPVDKINLSGCHSSSCMKSVSERSSCSGVPKKVSIHEESWHTYDGSSPDRSSRSSRTSVKAPEKYVRPTDKITVPIGRVRRYLPDNSGSRGSSSNNWWKYALVALAAAIAAGFAIRRQMAK